MKSSLSLVKDTDPGFGKIEGEPLSNTFCATRTDVIGVSLNVSRSMIKGQEDCLWVSAIDGPGATFALFIPPYTESSGDIQSRLLTSIDVLHGAER